MTVFVLDASVAAKWFLNDEALTEKAASLLRAYADGRVRFIVPDLFWAELANILWKALRQGRCTQDAAHRAIESLHERRLPTVSSMTLVDMAFRIAITFGRTVYDALYIALAVQSNAELITADEKLANALAAQLPVKWLGGMLN